MVDWGGQVYRAAVVPTTQAGSRLVAESLECAGRRFVAVFIKDIRGAAGAVGGHNPPAARASISMLLRHFFLEKSNSPSAATKSGGRSAKNSGGFTLAAMPRWSAKAEVTR